MISEKEEETKWELNEGTVLVTEQVEDPDTSETERGNAVTVECRVDTQEQHNGGSNDAWGSDGSVGSVGPPSVETVVSNDSSTQNSEESGLEIDDDSDSGKSWEWDPVWDFGVNPDECEEVIEALKEVSEIKFKHGKGVDATGSKGIWRESGEFA